MNTVQLSNDAPKNPSELIKPEHIELTENVYESIKAYTEKSGFGSNYAISQEGEVSRCDIPYSDRYETHYRISCIDGYGLEIFAPGRKGGNLQILKYRSGQFHCGYDFRRYAIGDPDYFFFFGGDRPNNLHEGRESLYADFIAELQAFKEVFDKVPTNSIVLGTKDELMNELS